jgi:exoribonuclease R
MYRILVDDCNYSSYSIMDADKNKQPDIIINPIEMKLLNNDIFNLNGEIVYSPTRLNKYNAGVLILNKTYGKFGTKFLYLCKPDDNKLPHFLIPHFIHTTFDKLYKDHYITFEFKHWNDKYPIGTITQNIGTVDESYNFYEYMLYCKTLHVSIHSFTKDVLTQTKKENNIIENIIQKYNIPFRDTNAFTIDSKNSIDFDDAISIYQNTISVYIANVPIILEHLNSWSSFTNRISNIYLPDKKRSMLPPILAQLCSLNKGEKRICFVMDIDMITNETTLSICYIIVSNNYSYNDDSLLSNKDYLQITTFFKYKHSTEIISQLMVMINTKCAEYMKKYQNGIYKILKNDNEQINISSYELYNDTCNYIHISSPIRRLVDILNMYQISINENLFQFGNNASLFYNKWIGQIEYINTCARNIRKVQSNCKILSMCENHALYKGKIFDKCNTKDNKYKYQVFLTELNAYSKIIHDTELSDSEEYTFKLFIFHDESRLKKKIRIELLL